jgi:hypothetical protein
MTTTTTAPGSAASARALHDDLISPDARRFEPPRWRDKRLVLGVVLVLLSVLLGARLFAISRSSTPILVAARPLVAGHAITSGDLEVDRVSLGSVAAAYWPAADLAGLSGHPLTSAVARGDLLPRSAVGATANPQPTRVVSLPVEPGRLPPLSVGDLVDVFATTTATSAADGQTVAVLRGVPYLGEDDTGSGSTVSVRLEVPVSQTAAVIRASEVDTLDVVLEQPAGDDAGEVGTTPLS